MTSKIKYLFCIIFIAIGLIISGCGGSGGGGSLISGAPSTNSVSAGAGTGSMSFSFQWPGYSKNTGKYISHVTNSIDLSITMENFQTSKKYSRPDNGIVTDTIEGLPEGEATILVEAKDLNGELLAQRFIKQKITDGLNASLSIDLGVTIDCAGFTPQIITVPINTTLMWVNNDTVSHSLVNVMYGFVIGEKGIGPFDGKEIFPGSSKSYTFSEAGTYMYKESSNDSLMGTVEVKGVPVVTGIEPFAILSGERGTRSITITGEDFWNEQGSSKVYFTTASGVVEANVTTWANDSITCTIPSNAISGDVFVQVAASASNSRYLSVFTFDVYSGPITTNIKTMVFAMYNGTQYLFVGGTGDAVGGGVWNCTVTGTNYDLGAWSGSLEPIPFFDCIDLRTTSNNLVYAGGIKSSDGSPRVYSANLTVSPDFNAELLFSAGPPTPMGAVTGVVEGAGRLWCVGNIDINALIFHLFVYNTPTLRWVEKITNNEILYDINFPPGSNNGLAVGDNNAIFAYSIPLGWSNISGNLPPGLFYMKNVIFSSESGKTYITGSKNDGGALYGTVIIGDQGGGPFTVPITLNPSAASSFDASAFVYAPSGYDHIWSCGTEFWYSHDTGQNWTKLNIDPKYYFVDIFPLSDDVVFAVGFDGSSIPGTPKIYKITRVK